MTDVVILGGARTAIGTFGGSLAKTPPVELGTTVAKASLARSGMDPAKVGHVVFGNVINTNPKICTSAVSPQRKQAYLKQPQR